MKTYLSRLLFMPCSNVLDKSLIRYRVLSYHKIIIAINKETWISYSSKDMYIKKGHFYYFLYFSYISTSLIFHVFKAILKQSLTSPYIQLRQMSERNVFPLSLIPKMMQSLHMNLVRRSQLRSFSLRKLS